MVGVRAFDIPEYLERVNIIGLRMTTGKGSAPLPITSHLQETTVKHNESSEQKKK